MGLLDMFKGKEKETKLDAPKKPRKSKKTAKEIANDKGEAYFEIVDFEFDPEDPTQGAFELDWNQEFVQGLRRAGYPGVEDEEVIDNYFTSVCRHVVLETMEKEEAMNPDTRQVRRNDLGNGKTEYS